MYNQAGSAISTGAGAGVLAYTGAPAIIWLLLCAFALIAAGSALLRILPKRGRTG
jgi:hypothetical protein